MPTLVTGGVKSGKSRHALDLAKSEFGPRRFFIATSAILDEEMTERIERHRAERKAPDGTDLFETIEEQVRIDEALVQALAGAVVGVAGSNGKTGLESLAGIQPRVLPGIRPGDRAGVLVDCLPMWVNNLMYHKRESEFDTILESFIRAMSGDVIIVTNETGLGNIPFDAETRRYNILLAEANRRIAAACDRVVLMVSGIPLRIK
jgi:adenosylcobinamide kinase/adenosylcobinamide-phosphate guanylyltransferase